MSHSNSCSKTPAVYFNYSISQEPKPPTADILTFRYEKDNVFVKVPMNYVSAVDTAISEFDELQNVPRERVGFCAVYREKGQEAREIRISAGAWPAFVSDLPRGAVIRVILRPDPDTKTHPPTYTESPGADASCHRPIRRFACAREAGSPVRPLPIRPEFQEGSSTGGPVKKDKYGIRIWARRVPDGDEELVRLDNYWAWVDFRQGE